MKKPIKETVKKTAASLLAAIVLPFLAVDLIFDLIVKGDFSGFRWDILAVMCLLFLVTQFVWSQTEFK